MFVDKADKRRCWAILSARRSRALVFTRTKHGADRVAAAGQARVHAEAIHGNKSQNARQRALANFKTARPGCWWRPTSRPAASTSTASRTSSTTICPTSRRRTCTASAARRAPGPGMAVSFCDSEERAYLKDIERLIKVRIPVVEDHPWHSHGGVVSAPEVSRPSAAPAPSAAAPAPVVTGAGPGPSGAAGPGPSRSRMAVRSGAAMAATAMAVVRVVTVPKGVNIDGVEPIDATYDAWTCDALRPYYHSSVMPGLDPGISFQELSG